MEAALCDKVWRELHKLRDIPAPGEAGETYTDYAAFAACNDVRITLGRCSELPREEFLSIFDRLVAGPRMEELFSLFKGSRRHPALQYTCFLMLHGVAELSDRREEMLARPDVVREFLSVLASPRQRVVTPASAGVAASEVVNTAAGAITTITGLFSSTRTLEPDYAKLWVELGAVASLASCLERHAAFDRATPVTSDLPLCFFLISTSLLAGAAGAVSHQDKLRLGTAWLQLFVDARRWIAQESADLLADFFDRPEWLNGVVGEIPEGLRARATEAALECQREGGSWKVGRADRLARALQCANVPCVDAEGRAGRRCAGPGCARVRTGGGVGDGDGDGGQGSAGACFKRCSRCHVLYCSRECQAAHWKAGHRKACVRTAVGESRA